MHGQTDRQTPDLLIVIILNSFFYHGATAPSGPRPSHCREFMITLGRTPLDEWSARSRDLYLTTHQETDIHVPRGIRTRKPNKRAASDPGLRCLLHWERHRPNTNLKFFWKGEKKDYAMNGRYSHPCTPRDVGGRRTSQPNTQQLP